MAKRDAYQVFLLIDRAHDLAATRVGSGRLLLGLAAGRVLAGDVAYGQPDVVGEALPLTVEHCVRRARERVEAWERTELSTSGHLLVDIVVGLDDELSR